MMEPLERVAVLLTLMRELESVMRLENGMLRDMRLGRMAQLHAEKAALAEAYEVELRTLRSAPEVLAGLPGSVREGLEEAMRSFQAAVGINAQALGAARTVVEGIVRRIAESLEAVKPAGSGYSGTAGVEMAAGRVISVAFDRRF